MPIITPTDSTQKWIDDKRKSIRTSNPTYFDLFKALQNLSQHELEMNVTIYIDSTDEYFPVQYLRKSSEIDESVVEQGHLLLAVESV